MKSTIRSSRAALFVPLFIAFLLGAITPLQAAPPDLPLVPPLAASARWSDLQPIVGQADAFGETPSLGELGPGQPTVALTSERPGRIIPVYHPRRSPTAPGALPQRDPVLQSAKPTRNTPNPSNSFDGINNIDGYTPPDTVGAIGPSNYVQAVNVRVQVFNRLTGAAQTAANPISSLFTTLGTGSKCATTDDGDPMVVYDSYADRWLIAQFANASSTTGPFYMSIAISKTSDPTGAYYAYCFQIPGNLFPDYPKFGVWSDGYYMSVNQFNAAGTVFLGAGVYAFDRAKMLVGDATAKMIYFNLNNIDPSIGSLQPANADGPPPPLGTPCYFTYLRGTSLGDATDDLRVFQFHVDFANTNLATFTERADSPVAVAAYSAFSPSGGGVPQSGTSALLDTLSDRLMFRLQYRNFGAYESLVVAHTATGGSGQAAMRYYQLKRNLPGGNFGVNEQATYAPDSLHRWMGSAAMNYRGDLAVGYSVSSSGTFPSIRYAARLGTDPANGLFQGEAILITGGGSQTDTGGRWGDYSCMTVDPTDDCTFWYTQEYYATTSATGWRTRIGSFSMPGCSASPRARIQGTVTSAITGLPVFGAVVRTASGYFRTTAADGTYSFTLTPGTNDLTAFSIGLGTNTLTAVVVTNGEVRVQNFALGVITPVLSVNPATGFTSGGQPGGPFSPGSVGYTLSNTGSTNLDWSVSAAAAWLTLSASSGSLAVGASTNVTVTINSAANSLRAGAYSDTLGFNNLGSGVGNTTRSVSLTITNVAPLITTNGWTLSSESCTNGAMDPGETVKIDVSLKNIGSGDSANLVATLLATGGVTSPSAAQNYGALAAGGASATRPFTFTATGACGSSITATFQLQDGPTSLGTVTLTFPLGTFATLITENFDGVTAPALPAGWTTATSGGQSLWVTSTSQADTSPNAAFASDAASAGVNELVSPAIALPAGQAELTFRHNYNTESSYDGGVLEIKIGAGAFTDLVTAGGSFLTGGYNRALNTSANPLTGRQAWSGSSSGFITTTATLPTAAAGQSVQFRWRCGSDESLGGVGWYVDSVVVNARSCCGGGVVGTPLLSAGTATLAAESCLATNGAVDPGETVTLNLGVKNIGTASTTNLVATLLSTGGVTSPSSPQTYGALATGGAAASRPFTFTASGACGSTLTATLQLQDGASDLGLVTYNFILGVVGIVASENFDGIVAPALPAGWTTATSGAQTVWKTDSVTRDTLPNAAFSAEAAATGVNELTSPVFALPSGSTQLTFRNNYNLEPGFDGGVLEIKIGAGAWTDIVTAGGNFVSGGYNQTVSSSFDNPLAGRQAWSGNSAGFVTTIVNLPVAAAGQTCQFKWRCGSDSSFGGVGWFVDSVSLSGGTCCTGSTAPSILTQPQSQSANLGDNVTFTVSATGSAPLSYQWLTNGLPISGANSNGYTKLGVTLSDALGYSVIITNSLGSVTSSVATLTVLTGYSGVLAGWDMNPLTNFGVSPLSPTTNAPNVTVGGLTRGPGVATTVTAAARAWGGNDFTTGSAADAITAGDYATLGVTAKAGYKVSFSSVSTFDYRRSGSGATNGVLQYQLGASMFTDLATLDYSSTSTSGASLPAIDLSAIPELQSVGAGTNVTFRIVNFGATDPGGTWYIYDVSNTTALDFALSGGVAPVVVTNPPAAAPLLTSVKLAGNQFQFTLTGTPGSNYVVQVSTNLSDSNWIGLQTNAAPFLFIESNAVAFPQRFYRGVLAP